MKFLRIFLLLILPVYFFSCAPQHKLPNYLENVIDTSGTLTVKPVELRIQKGDLLSIQVFSVSTFSGADELYNMPGGSSSTSATGSSSGAPSAPSTAGYLVDINGNIQHHRLGLFHAEGLTKEELADQIKKKLTEPVVLLKDPTVIIRYLNFKVTVIGQVGKEGAVTVPGERLTILEAIGLAGGITDYGKKESVRVIRESNGKREVGLIDLSTKDLFDSRYYNLEQNDVVVVEPTKQKAKQTDQALVTQRISFALSIITAAAFIYNIFK